MIRWLREKLGIVGASESLSAQRVGEAMAEGFAAGIVEAKAAEEARGRPMTLEELVIWVETDPRQRAAMAQARRIRDANFPEDA